METKAEKKLRGIEDQDRCKLCEFQRETVQHPIARWNNLAGKEYIRIHQWSEQCNDGLKRVQYQKV